MRLHEEYKLKKTLNKKFFRVRIFLEVLLVLLLVYSFSEPYFIEIKETMIESLDIPSEFDGFTIVFISDIHFGQFYGKSRIEKITKMVKDIHPDLLVFGGDYITEGEYARECFHALEQMKAPYGVYGVLGNHDTWEGKGLILRCMHDAGITPIDNKSVWIEKLGKRIKLGGVSDLWTDSQDVNATLSDTNDSDYVILTSHNPDYIEKIKNKGVDLMLSGHTHGGQITFFGLSPSHVQKYKNGPVDFGNTKVLVSNGLGSFFKFPIRFCARPQINVVRLKGVHR